MYHGDIRLGDTLDLKFTTRRFTTGAPFTLAGSPVISAYVGNSTTELTAGITLTVDFDSRTGLNHVRVVATSGNGYATASNYELVITTGTVDSVSVVGEVVASFSIEARSALMPATAGRTLVVDAAGLADANTVKVGPTGSGTAQTAGDIIGDTNDIQARLPAALVGGKMDSNVGTISAGAITAASIATGAIDADAIATDAVTEIQAGLATAASITALQTSVDDLPTNAELATALAAADDAMLAQIALVKAKTDNLPVDPADASDIAASFASLTTLVNDVPTNAKLATALAAADDATLAAIAALSTSVGDIPTNAEIATALDAIPTAGENADAVWDEAIAGHLSAGSTGLALSNAGAAGDPWSTPLPGAYASGTAGKIVGDNVNATISSRATQTSVDDLPTNAEFSAGLAAADDATLAAIAALSTSVGDVPTVAEIADGILIRHLAGGSNVTGPQARNIQSALRVLRNYTNIAAGVMTAREEDDVTVAWTASVTTAPGDPLTSFDPT